jgi:hypothetical protein
MRCDAMRCTARNVQRAGLRVLDGPGEFPFAIGGYYAFYFRRPDELKFEVVYGVARQQLNENG